MTAMSKTERTELRSIVKQQFRVLLAEVDQRRAELLASVEEEIAQRFAAADQTWSAFEHKVHEITMAANRQFNDALYEFGYEERSGSEKQWVRAPSMTQPNGERIEMRRLAQARIEAQIRDARVTLNRQEADLLRDLAVGALESDAAREFLAAIPSVGELVPAARLRELVEGGESA